MIKKYYLFYLLFCCAVTFGYGQVTTIDFETAGDGYSSSSTTPGDGWQDIFDRTNHNMTIINNEDGFYWALEDTAGSHTIDIDQIDITGATDFQFSLDWIAHHYNDWDADTEFSITYSIDGGTYQNLIWVRSVSGTNTPAAVDIGFDGTGDCGTTTTLPSRSTGSSGGCTVSSTRDQFETYSAALIALSANTTLDIRLSFENFNAGDEGIYLDNIEIDVTLPSCSPPADPNGTITGTTPACTSTTLTYTGIDTTPLLLLNYWQTSLSGIDQSNDAVNTYNATTSGTYYVRKYDVAADCWSTNSVSYDVVIESAVPTISAQPTDQAVIIPTTATFSITSGDATSYQWQVSTNGGSTWNNVTGGTGDNTDTYTTGATSLLIDGNQYRCLATNACGSTTSSPATLSAATLANVVITEIMYNTTGSNDDEWIEICNVSGSSQSLNNYTIEVNGTTEFTFPSSGVTITDGDCITISLGDGGGANYNPDCPFTPDYTNGSGTGTLNNTSDTISLIAPDGSTTIDTVTYDDGDGADGTGESLHVVDTSLDNSVTNTNWWEVLNGGSPGTNSLISPCTPVGPEINVEGNTGNFPDISNGDTTPNTFDGTDFGDLNVGSTLDNPFRIENFGGTQNLNITSVSVLSGDTSDFSISSFPSSPIIPADPNGFSVFEIRFQPTIAGTRTAIIQIRSNDSDEDPYTFTVTGNGLCVANAITALPSTGPIGTVVSVTGTDLATATASFNGIPATVNNISATLMEVTVPASATTGNLEIIDSLGCPGSTPYTVIDSEISSCEGSGGTIPTDLFISEITDATYGGLTYIELFNGTGASINIDNYSIEVIYNGDATALALNILDLDNVNVASGSTYVIAVGRQTPVSSTNACTSTTGGSGELASSANAQFNNGGINKKDFEHDVIRLVNSGSVVDEFGVYQDDDWMDSTIISGDRGFNFRRLNTATTLPDPTFTLAELSNWTVIDWVGSGSSSCSGNDYSDIGSFDFSTGTAPIVNSISSSTTSCNELTLNVSANEGFSGGNMLAYYWYFYNPAQSGLGWQAIINGGIYTTSNNSPNLIISNVSSVSDYQFYCEVREDDSTCYTASNAIQVSASTATWDGTNWVWNDGTLIDTLPNSNTVVIINNDYNTGNLGIQDSFSACSLTINSGYDLVVSNGKFIEVEGDVVAEDAATVLIETQGAFIQRGVGSAAGTFLLNGTASSQVNKLTAPLVNWYDYTYWSSPVATADVDVALGFALPERRFWFNATNYEDVLVNATGLGGSDDIDDTDDDWLPAQGTGQMIPGRGYAATHSAVGFLSGNQYQYNFLGALNTGDYSNALAFNASNTNHWNLVGNPYPSAIQVRGTNGLFDANVGIIKTAVYLWSHDSPPLDLNPGNEGLNFNTNDYATINETMSIAGASGILPGNYIPSGQSFFVSSLQSVNLNFNNAMRISGDNSNDLFFRNATNNVDHSQTENLTNESRLWLNLKSEDGIFSQIGIGYVQNATDGFDGLGYDAKRNLSSNNVAIIYSRIEGEDRKLAIQGKATSSLSTQEIVPIGFNSTINEVKIYKFSLFGFEGDFLENNGIYIKDYLLNTIHNLKESDYSFASNSGEFNNRFEIVFTPDALSVKDHILDAGDLTIVELTDGDVKIKTNSNHTIVNVDIIDVTGRLIYTLKGDSSTEVYDLSRLSKAAYIAKVTLSNGQVISKKAIKQH